MKISINLDEYEIVNLFQAFKIIPNNGEWKLNIISKVIKEIENVGLSKENLESSCLPNSGLSIKDMKRHLEILELKEKRKI